MTTIDWLRLAGVGAFLLFILFSIYLFLKKVSHEPTNAMAKYARKSRHQVRDVTDSNSDGG